MILLFFLCPLLPQQKQQASSAICLYFIYYEKIMKNEFNAPSQDINRGTEKQCYDCQKKFSIVARQHQCKRCLKPICSDCGNHRRQVYSQNFQLKIHKVCKNCKQLSSFTSQLVKSQNLGFGKMSDTGKKWMKKITSKPSIFGTDTSQHKSLSRQVFNQLWGTYSYQLRELIGHLTYKYQQDGVYNVVYGVYTTVISSLPHYKLGQIIYLVVFILCFCSADKAPFIVLYLVELKDSIKNLKEMMNNYIKVLPFRHQISKIGDYINYRYDKFIDSFLVNCLTVQCSIAMISKIIQRKSVEDLLITFTSHIFANRDNLLQRCQEKNVLLDHLMLRKCLPEQFITVSKYFKGKNLALISPQISHQSQKNIKKNGQFSQSFDPSPKIQMFQQIDAKIKINLVQRQSYGQNQNNYTNEDSFSLHISPNQMHSLDKRNLSPQNFSKGNKLYQQYLQFSPQTSNFSRNSAQGISPSKSAQQNKVQIVDINKNKESAKLQRKYTEVSYQQTKVQCDKCSLTQKYYEKQLSKAKIELQLLQSTVQKVKQQKQLLKSQQYIRKNRIIQLQSIKSSQQNKSKQLNQTLKQLYQKIASQSQNNKKIQQQLKNLKDKLLNQTNETIKLHSQLQQQKRNVKQARQLCLQASKQNDQLNIKMSKLQAIHKDLLLEYQRQTNNCKKSEGNMESLKTKINQYERKQQQFNRIKQQTAKWEKIYQELVNKNNVLKQTLSQSQKHTQQKMSIIQEKQAIISDMKQQSINFKQISQQKQKLHTNEIQKLTQRIKSLQSLYTSSKEQNDNHKTIQALMTSQNINHQLKIQNSKLQQELSHQLSLLQQRQRENKSLLSQKDQFIQKLKQSNQYYKKCYMDKEQEIKHILSQNNKLKQQISTISKNSLIQSNNDTNTSKIKILQLQIIDLTSKLSQLNKEKQEYIQKIKGLLLSSKQMKDEDEKLREQILTLKAQIQAKQQSLTSFPLQLHAKQTQIAIYKKQLFSLNPIKQQLQRQKKEKKQLFLKLQDISILMMKVQQEKMEIADQLFQINEFLKKKGIKYY